MAVEANVRKRKHSQTENNGEEVIPKKIHKKSKTPKKVKNNITDNEIEFEQTSEKGNESDGERMESETPTATMEPHDSVFEEKPIRFPKDFSISNFRTKLRSSNFITELRHFLFLKEKSNRIVIQYIEKRGKPLELVEALERVDKTNLLHIAYICEAMQAVVMEILSNYPNHMESAVSACRCFVKVYSKVVDQLLESSQIKLRRIALKLLTAIVCIDPQMGRQLLAAFNILSDVRKIEQLISHSKYEQQEEETVRKCYIHFILSFFVDGNALLIQNIIDRGSLIQALLYGLTYDDYVTVCLVLGTLKKYVLENPSISKTKKIHVFNVECCRKLVYLYDWRGPKVFAAKFMGKQGTKTESGGVYLTEEQIASIVDGTERKKVATAVHELLLTLFTSRKHGISFDALTHFRQRHNVIQGKAIGSIIKPWCSELKTELIIQTLKACPDLARHTVRHFSSTIKLNRAGEKEFSEAAYFLVQIIEALHPNLLRPALLKITLTDFGNWIKEICLPLETLLAIKSHNILRHANALVRLSTHRLLLAMFTQYANFMNMALQREQSKSGVSSLRRFKFDLFSHILTNFPSVDNILSSLFMTTSVENSMNIEFILEHLNVTLDLILIICKQNRSFVNRTSTILDYLKLLRPIYAGEEDDDDEDGEEEVEGVAKTRFSTEVVNSGDIRLEFKAIKTILLLHPNALEPQQKLFGHVLKSFIKGFLYGTEEIQRESGNLLREIFKNTGIFEACSLEIDLWLEALKFSNLVTVDMVTQVFREVLKSTQANVDLPNSLETMQNSANLNYLFENIEKGHSVQTYVESFAMSKLLPLIFKGVEIVKPVDEYIELICMLLIQYHPMPNFVSKVYEMQFGKQPEYMAKWLSEKSTLKELEILPDVCKTIPGFKDLHEALLKKSSNSSPDIEQLLEKLPQHDERLILIYVNQIFFLITQLSTHGKLQRSHAEFASSLVKNFLNQIHAIEENQGLQSIADNEEELPVSKLSFLGSILSYIYDARLSQLNSFELCSLASEEQTNFLVFIKLIAEQCSELPNFSSHVKIFRLKLLKAIAISLDTLSLKKEASSTLEFVKMIEAFHLDAGNCVELLDLLCTRLKYSDFFISNQKTCYYDLLISAMKRLASLQEALECKESVMTLSKFYTKFLKKFGNEINLEDFEIAYHDLLYVMHQYITELEPKLFKITFEGAKVSKAKVKLVTLLLERNPKLHEEFLQLIPDHLEKKELIYPLLEVIFKKNLAVDSSLLTKVYQEYRNGFMKSIEKPQKVGVIYKEHTICSIALVKSCMPLTECLDFCKKRLQLTDSSELYQILLINSIYEKAFKSLIEDKDGEQSEKIFVNYLNLQIQMLGLDLKRQSLTIDKLELFAYQIQKWFQMKILEKDESKNQNIEAIISTQNWQTFCKSCLKFGMQINEDPLDIKLSALILHLMAYLCDKFYGENAESSTELQEPAQLFEMICSHSKYYDIVLSTKEPNEVKTAVLKLLYVLAKKSPSMALQHLEVPALLGAYQAKLTPSDRFSLALLQLYEFHYPQKLQKFRPFIWGESATSFYALHVSDLDERNRLTQQETTSALVMSLIEKQTCEHSLENFPIWRKLNATKQLPEKEFVDPQQKVFKSRGSNDLEQQVEFMWLSKETLKLNLDLRLCPEAEDSYNNCYDPAFFVPLMSSCFAPEAYTHTARPVQNGLLAFCFAALSSQDKEMRQAAGIVQLRYRQHFEQSKFFERPLWIQAYDNIQAGLEELANTWKDKNKKHSKEYVPIPRVPFIPALFVAKTFNITNDPTNLLYKQLTMYLRLKNIFDFQCVPEFNIFFHSTEVDHHTYRQFIIEIIRQGVKCSSDLFLLVSTNTFKVLLGFYGGPMSTLETNLSIISVMATCATIPASAKIMIDHVGILPWLQTIISNLEFFHFDIIEGIITIINNLWYSITAARKEFHHYNYVTMELYRLIIQLLPYISARISSGKLANLLNIMQKSAAIVEMCSKTFKPYEAVTSDQLDKLLGYAEKHFLLSHVQHLRNLKTLGGAGADSCEIYCTKLYKENIEASSMLALTSLRLFIIDWWQTQQQTQENEKEQKKEEEILSSCL